MRPTPRKPERPVLWIIAGPNGSGKSSFYNRTDFEGWGGSVWIINPDLLTARIVEQEGLQPDAANLASVQRIEAWLDASISVHQTIGVETVLSSSKYRRLVLKAQSRGFEVRFVYFLLASAELQLQRIRFRVAEGGHDVPEHKVRERRLRSFRQMAWFCRKADRATIFDNSTGEPEILATRASGGALRTHGDLPADLRVVLARLGVPIA